MTFKPENFNFDNLFKKPEDKDRFMGKPGNTPPLKPFVKETNHEDYSKLLWKELETSQNFLMETPIRGEYDGQYDRSNNPLGATLETMDFNTMDGMIIATNKNTGITTKVVVVAYGNHEEQAHVLEAKISNNGLEVPIENGYKYGLFYNADNSYMGSVSRLVGSTLRLGRPGKTVPLIFKREVIELVRGQRGLASNHEEILLNISMGSWSRSLAKKLGISEKFFSTLLNSGSIFEAMATIDGNTFSTRDLVAMSPKYLGEDTNAILPTVPSVDNGSLVLTIYGELKNLPNGRIRVSQREFREIVERNNRINSLGSQTKVDGNPSMGTGLTSPKDASVFSMRSGNVDVRASIIPINLVEKK